MSLSELPGDIVRRDAEDGAHLMVRDDPTDHQLWLIGQPTDTTPLGRYLSRWCCAASRRRRVALLAIRRAWAASKASPSTRAAATV